MEPGSAAEIEAVVRRYLARVARRYAPAGALLLALALIVAFVPSRSPSGRSTGTGTAAGGAAGAAGAAGTASGVGGGAGGFVGAGAGSSTGPALGGSAGSVVTGGSSGAQGPTVASSGAPATEAPGLSRTGVSCGTGVRQFSWSRYAPLCVPAFHGSNGGATGQGVTASTITLAYRIPNSAQQQAIDALAGAANINDPAYISDLRSYINFFNTQFELYGRKVVLKAFNGQGDYINEDQGQDLAAAQSDAVTAREMGAFGDVTFSLESSQPYEQDLANEHVISFSGVAEPHTWFERYSPYEFSVQGPDGTVGVDNGAAVVCRRLAGMPAIFAGDALYQHQTRTFGLIYPENPQYAEEVQQWQQLLATECGAKVSPVIAYSINIAEYETEATQAMAKMKAAGVTTLLCACDPIFPILMTNAQQQQSYYPEILAEYFGDPVARDYSAQAYKYAMVGGIQFPPVSGTEAYKAYQIGYPGQHPAEWAGTSPPYFFVPYYTLMQIFDALQAAGPDLSAATFERGMFSVPASEPGDVVGSQWVFGNQVFDPVSSFGIAWWDPNAISAFDGAKGAYQWCNGATIYQAGKLGALGGPHQQLNCFRR